MILFIYTKRKEKSLSIKLGELAARRARRDLRAPQSAKLRFTICTAEQRRNGAAGKLPCCAEALHKTNILFKSRPSIVSACVSAGTRGKAAVDCAQTLYKMPVLCKGSVACRAFSPLNCQQTLPPKCGGAQRCPPSWSECDSESRRWRCATSAAVMSRKEQGLRRRSKCRAAAATEAKPASAERAPPCKRSAQRAQRAKVKKV